MEKEIHKLCQCCGELHGGETGKVNRRERKSRAENDRRRSVPEENGKGVYKVVTYYRVGWCMLQGPSLHRTVERERGRVAEKKLEKCMRCERRL